MKTNNDFTTTDGSLICSAFQLLELLTVVPIWVTMNCAPPPPLLDIHTFKDVLLFIVFGFQTTRILRAFRLGQQLDAIEDTVYRCIANFVLTIGIMMLFSKSPLSNFHQKIQQIILFLPDQMLRSCNIWRKMVNTTTFMSGHTIYG